MTRDDFIKLGFKEYDHTTIGDTVTYDINDHRYISATSIGTPNEMIAISEYELSATAPNQRNVTDIVILHNYDYDGYITHEKLMLLLKFFNIY